MSNSSNNDLLFLAPVIAIFTIAITFAAALYYKDRLSPPEVSTVSSNIMHRQPTATASTTLNHSEKGNFHNFDMPEPFAQQVPFEFTPAAWMQMMNTMMNTMQMTQMMHQMAAMPSKMMPPTMNPHAMLPHGVANPSQQPMDPKEYKKWYEQQLESMKLNKK